MFKSSCVSNYNPDPDNGFALKSGIPNNYGYNHVVPDISRSNYRYTHLYPFIFPLNSRYAIQCGAPSYKLVYKSQQLQF